MKWVDLALLVLGLVFTAGCPREQEAPPTTGQTASAMVAESEPNDAPARAQRLTAPIRIRGRLDNSGRTDRDVFRIEPDAAGLVSASIDGVAETDVLIELLDGDGGLLARVDNSGAGHAEHLPPSRCAGACLVAVSGTGAGGDYVLAIDLAPDQSGSERLPNSRADEAQPIAAGLSHTGYLASAADEDWFAFAPGAEEPGQLLDVSLKSPAEARLELEVVAADARTRIARWTAAEPGDPIRIRSLTLPEGAGGCRLVVRNADAAADRKRGKARKWDPRPAYVLAVRAWAGVPHLEREPNETAEFATQLDRETLTAVGHVSPGADQDFFSFELSEPSIVRVELSGVPGIDVVAAVFSRGDEGTLTEVLRADAQKEAAGEVLTGVALGPGTHHVLVRGAARKFENGWRQTYANPDETYTLRLLVEPDDGGLEREPNDRADRATELAMDGRIRGHLHPAGDVDFFRVEVAHPTDVALHLTGVPGVDLSMRVREADPSGQPGAIVGSIDRSREGGDERLVIPFEPGTWVVEIRGASGQSSALHAYTLSLSGRPLREAALSP